MIIQRSVTVWRATHVLAYLCALATSIGALVCYRKMNAQLMTTVDKCLLFTKPWIDVEQSSRKCRIDYTRIEWSSDTLCNYVTFALLASFVYSIVAVWFFVMCAPTRGTELNDSVVHVWKIVAPASFLSGVMAMVTLVMAWKVTNGMNAFFDGLAEGARKNCSTSSAWVDDSVEMLYADRIPTKVFVWLVFFCWGFATVALLIRCSTAADFTVYSSDEWSLEEKQGVDSMEMQAYEPISGEPTTSSTSQTSLCCSSPLPVRKELPPDAIEPHL
ncbi:uncharacterized protein LOC144141092 isoform X2 [Haemaphysalis longicornis]